MSLASQFKTDKNKETSGIEVLYAPDSNGNIPTFFLARMGGANRRYNKALEAATRPFRRQIQNGTLSEEQADPLFKKVFAEHVVRSWRNVLAKDVTGDPSATGYLDFSPSFAIQLFDNLPDLYADLQEKANNAANFRDEILEEEAKN